MATVTCSKFDIGQGGSSSLALLFQIALDSLGLHEFWGFGLETGCLSDCLNHWLTLAILQFLVARSGAVKLILGMSFFCVVIFSFSPIIFLIYF